ncbi:unnamed protein product, partial [Pocillopora meandrina]
ISFSSVNILLSITAFLGNSLILFALHKESSLHPPSKLLYRCLATINSLVGLVVQPLSATYRMSLVHEHWSFCRYARDAIVISSYVLCGVSLMKMTAMSVDRLLAMLLGLRYKEIVTLRRTYIILAIVWVVCLVTGLFLSQLPYRLLVPYHNCTTWPGISSFLVISAALYINIFIFCYNLFVSQSQQPNKTNAPNMVRYRKTVFSALWDAASISCLFTFLLLLIQIRAERLAFFALSCHKPHSVPALYIMMATTNLTESGTYMQTFHESLCSPIWLGDFKQQSISFSAVNIFFSITAILGNSLILVALHKESSLHPPSKLLYSCLATSDLLVGLVNQPLYAAGWMSVVYEHWSFCRYARDATVISSSVLCVVSLMTMTAISVDRLLAMLLGLRYKEIVTLRRTYIILTIVWVVCLVAGLFSYLNYRIGLWYRIITIPSCLVISVASYTKIFRALSHHQAQIQDHVQRQRSQPSALNMARYRKAVYNAIWVQLALVVCYFPQFILRIVIFLSAKRFSNLFLIYGMGIFILFFNSTLNPFLYCWRISEVRRAVKQTIRQAICFAEGNICTATLIIILTNPESTALAQALRHLSVAFSEDMWHGGIFIRPLYATYWMSVVHKHWYSFYATSVTGYVICSVSLSMLTAMGVDRFRAMLLGLRYKENVSLRRIISL